jgi:uncharacterized protein (DUF885 family)
LPDNPLVATASGDHRYDNRLGDPISPQYLADSLARERQALADVLAVPPGSLDTEDRLSYEIFKRDRELAIEGFTFPSELLPVNPFDGMPQRFALLGSGAGLQPFATAKDYDNWLARMDGYAQWTSRAITNMRDGMRRGYVLPRELVERMLPQFEKWAEDGAANIFYQPLASMPPGIGEPQRSQLTERFNAAVKQKVLKAYRDMHDFLQTEYLPRARSDARMSSWPLGEAWYAYRVRLSTTTNLSPAEIHRLGLAEVERLRTRLQSLSTEAGFAGNVADYAEFLRREPRFHIANPEELLSGYRDLKVKMTAAAPTLFSVVPDADFEIRPVEPFREADSAPAFYQAGSPDGRRTAVLYVNTYDLGERPTYGIEGLFLKDAVPGRHFQFALQQERVTLPQFRRFRPGSAFAAGWALYAESLGEELGLFRDPAAKFAALLDEQRAALGLVVDTGLNAQGWTRRQALAYLHAQMPIDDLDAGTTIDRYLAEPGEVLGYQIGALRILAMRAKAQQALGARFDVRAFHAEILRDGSMPLDLLEAKVDRWVAGVP